MFTRGGSEQWHSGAFDLARTSISKCRNAPKGYQSWPQDPQKYDKLAPAMMPSSRKTSIGGIGEGLFRRRPPCRPAATYFVPGVLTPAHTQYCYAQHWPGKTWPHPITADPNQPKSIDFDGPRCDTDRCKNVAHACMRHSHPCATCLHLAHAQLCHIP